MISNSGTKGVGRLLGDNGDVGDNADGSWFSSTKRLALQITSFTQDRYDHQMKQITFQSSAVLRMRDMSPPTAPTWKATVRRYMRLPLHPHYSVPNQETRLIPSQS